MWDNPAVRPEELRMLENYEAIPLPVREALEGMSPEERRAVTRIITTLGENGFYLEGGHGGLAWV